MDSIEIPTLVTERLRLRPFCRSDFEDYAALYRDPEVLRHLAGAGEPWDRGRSWRHMAFAVGHWYLGGVGMWVVERLETGEFAGLIGFAAPEEWPGFELSWILARRWWGNGYATEGAQAALAHAFGTLGKDSVISLILPENRASIRVAERIGETRQSSLFHLGREMLCYGIDRDRYAVLASHSPLSVSAPPEASALRYIETVSPEIPGRPADLYVMARSHTDLSEGFHPRMLVEAVQEQAPQFPWLREALLNCPSGEWESRAYVRYVSRTHPNQPGSEWQFKTCVALSHETLGMVVLDVLNGNRLGGIEFVDKIES